MISESESSESERALSEEEFPTLKLPGEKERRAFENRFSPSKETFEDATTERRGRALRSRGQVSDQPLPARPLEYRAYRSKTLQEKKDQNG